MPDTKIFSGSRYTSMPFGGVGVAGRGSSATVTIKDQHNVETKCTLEVYELKKLARTRLYKEAKVISTDAYVASWERRRNGKSIIISAGANNLAFVFTSPGDVEQDFQKLIDSNLIPCGLFHEASFCHSLSSAFEMSVDDLKKLDGMTDRHFDLIQRNIVSIVSLSKLGMTLNEMAKTEPKRLELLLDKTHAIKQCVELGISIACLNTLDHPTLEYILKNLFDIRQVHRLGFTFDEIIASSMVRIQYLYSNQYDVKRLLELGVTKEALLNESLANLDFIKNNHYDVKRLIERGFSITEILQADKARLKIILSNSYQLEDALLFVTRQQILGASHLPPRLRDIKIPKDTGINLDGGNFSVSTNELSCSWHRGEFEATYNGHQTISQYKASVNELKDDLKATFRVAIQNAKHEKVLRDWYRVICKEDDGKTVQRVMYSPHGDRIIYESWDVGFPIELIENPNYHHHFIFIPYYMEKTVRFSMEKRGIDINALTYLSGMTVQRLDLIYQHWFTISEILDKGITIQQLASVDESWFEHVVKHFHKAKAALNFVSMRELLGLNALNPHRLHATTNLSEASGCDSLSKGNDKADPATDKRFCLLM